MFTFPLLGPYPDHIIVLLTQTHRIIKLNHIILISQVLLYVMIAMLSYVIMVLIYFIYIFIFKNSVSS